MKDEVDTKITEMIESGQDLNSLIGKIFAKPNICFDICGQMTTTKTVTIF